MPVTRFTAKITRVTQRTPDVRSYQIEIPPGVDFRFLPGQFVSLRLTKDGTVYGPRSYSISSSPAQRDSFEITLKKTGTFTTAIWDVPEGTDLQVTGPFGLFYLDPDKAQGRDICLIAGGTGIAPLMSMLRWAHERELPNKLHVLYSVRTREDVIFALELAERCNAYENLSCTVTLTREEGEWPGERGRINAEKLERLLPNLKGTDYFVCGPAAMVNDVVKALFSLGVERQRVKIERWE